MPILSQQASSPQDYVLGVRETADGARVLFQAFSQIQEVWRSTLEEAFAASRAREGGRLSYDAEHVRQLFEDAVQGRLSEGDVIRCIVGGGSMGSKLCHDNEAPFAERLVDFFIRSYAPPGSIVLDPFSGSGTTASVAVRLGRRALGFDLRPDQVDVARKRIAGETPDLFASHEEPTP